MFFTRSLILERTSLYIKGYVIDDEQFIFKRVKDFIILNNIRQFNFVIFTIHEKNFWVVANKLWRKNTDIFLFPYIIFQNFAFVIIGKSDIIRSYGI